MKNLKTAILIGIGGAIGLGISKLISDQIFKKQHEETQKLYEKSNEEIDKLIKSFKYDMKEKTRKAFENEEP